MVDRKTAKIHFKMRKWNPFFQTWVNPRPACLMDNKTFCFDWSLDWEKVTCKMCLKKRPIKIETMMDGVGEA